MATLKQRVAGGMIWALIEKLSVQTVGFVVSMVLARLLTPDDYGTVALLSIFFALAGVFTDIGFGDALIQKKAADDLDFNSVFYSNVVLAIIAYAILYVIAPWVADFYHTPILTGVMRLAALSVVMNAINGIQNAWLTKKMLFNLSFRISFVSCIVSGVVGVTMAYLGYGVWALVWSTLLSGLVGVVMRWVLIAWRPKLMFSFARLKPLFSYGWKMAASGLLDSFFSQLNGLLIGKFYTKADLAFVNKGNALPQLAMGQVDGTLGRVSLPALVEFQDDRDKLRDATRRMIQCSTFLGFPLMVGIAVCAKPLILLLFGSQWLPAVPYMAIACFSFALMPFHTINLRAIIVLGRSDIFLKLEIIKKVAKLVVILAAFRYGVLVFVAVSAFALGPMSVLINAWPNKKLLNYTIGMQIMDVLPTAAVCAAMSVIVYGIDWAWSSCALGFDATRSNWSLIGLLIIQCVVGAAVFFALSYVFRVKPMGEYSRMAAFVLEKRVPRMASALRRRFA